MNPVKRVFALSAALALSRLILLAGVDAPPPPLPLPTPARPATQVRPSSPPKPATPPQAATASPAVTSTQVLTSAASPTGPLMAFDSMIYDFGKVMASQQVKHSFIFTNTGTETLYLTNVIPTCGCTTAGDWTRVVEPGKTGAIHIGFHGTSSSGQVIKGITIQSNDRQHPVSMLQIKATIWRPIDVTPQYAVMTITPDAETGATTVRIVNNMEEPLTLFPPELSNKGFTATLITNQPGKEFQLSLSAGPNLPPGSSQCPVTMRTSATNTPVLSVTALAYVQPAVSVMPPQIGIPAAPLANRVAPSITVVNNSTNKMTISEPAINASGVDVQARELQPGKTFTFTLGFPQGYEIPPGQQIAFTARTDNPRLPLIKVPIIQSPKKAPAPIPAPPAAATPKTARVQPTTTPSSGSGSVAN